MGLGLGLGRVRVRVRLDIGLGLGFSSGQSQCVPLFRSVNYHILVKSGTRRSCSVPPFRSGNYTNPDFGQYLLSHSLGGANSDVRRIWSIGVFDQTCCAFAQLRKPNSNPNLTLTLKPTLTNPIPCHNPNPNTNPNPIASALRD